MKKHKPYNLDKVDMMLIRELEIDSKQTSASLAAKIGVSTATARRRLERLLKKRVISLVALANPSAIGYQAIATIGIRVQPDKIEAVSDKLASYACVPILTISTGRYEILAWVIFRHVDELSAFLTKELSVIPGVLGTETMLTLELKKHSIAYLANGVGVLEGASPIPDEQDRRW